MFSSFLYNQLLRTYRTPTRCQKLLRHLLTFLRKLFIKCGDPECSVPVRGKDLYMPLSHQLPIYLATHPCYDGIFTRVSEYLRTTRGKFVCVDVGANIGDSIAACYAREDDHFLAIEANPHFVRYLKKNSQHIPNITLLEIYCASSDGAFKFTIDEKGGTATISQSCDDGHIIESKTLDTIIDENSKYARYNFLKIDTDGYDFEVIKGARRSIQQNQPVILFECGFWGRKEYIKDLVEIIHSLAQAGYSSAIVYDNLGYLYDVLKLHEVSRFKYALFHQLISETSYFDILVMTDDEFEMFLSSEISYFIHRLPAESKQHAAYAATELYA